MTDQTNVGDFRERIGEMRGQLVGLQSSVNRIEGQVAVNQAINSAAHDRQDAAIAELGAKLAVKLAEDGTKGKLTGKFWDLLSGGLGGAIAAFCLEWFVNPKH